MGTPAAVQIRLGAAPLAVVAAESFSHSEEPFSAAEESYVLALLSCLNVVAVSSELALSPKVVERLILGSVESGNPLAISAALSLGSTLKVFPLSQATLLNLDGSANSTVQGTTLPSPHRPQEYS